MPMPIQFIHCQLSANIYSLPMPIQFIHCQLSANFPYSLSIVCITAKSKIPCHFFFVKPIRRGSTSSSFSLFVLLLLFLSFSLLFSRRRRSSKKLPKIPVLTILPIPYVYIPSKGPIFIFCARSARYFFTFKLTLRAQRAKKFGFFGGGCLSA